MSAFERRMFIPAASQDANLLAHISEAVDAQTAEHEVPIRFVASKSGSTGYHCETALVDDVEFVGRSGFYPSVFEFVRRPFERQDSFTAVLLIPTGIGCEIGGHAGDATPVARLLAANCDTLILHPNVVNASDINESPPNALYCEGSTLTRLVMGTIGIRPVRSNRVLIVYDGRHQPLFKSATQNTVNAARATYGFNCAGICEMHVPVQLAHETASSGRATGRVENMGPLIEDLCASRGTFDAVAVASVIQVPEGTHETYFASEGEIINPWGGVEALLTHALTTVLGVPVAHAPMMESEAVANADLGVVDPRMAAEAVSLTFFNCVLKGLQQSPQIVSEGNFWDSSSVLSAADISCIIVPEGCLGLPTLAALYQGIPLISVGENKNLMKNRIEELPWLNDQFFQVNNYWEACGVMCALRAGIAPNSIRRPLEQMEPSVICR